MTARPRASLVRSSPMPDRIVRFELSAAAARVVERVEAAGAEILLAGGAVRDALLGRPVTDWDFATALRSEEIVRCLGGRVAADHSLGAVALDDGRVALNTFREEGDYGRDRRPAVVRFVTTPEADVVRRDFTVNGLYAPPRGGSVLDHCGGVADLDARRLRVIGAPVARLAEDPLRILRGVRLAAACGLVPEPATAMALQTTHRECRHLSAERVFQELTLAFTGHGRDVALRLLVELGVAATVLPGRWQPDSTDAAARRLAASPDGAPEVSWAAVLLGLGADVAQHTLSTLHAPRALTRTVGELCGGATEAADLPLAPASVRRAWRRRPTFGAHVAFHRMLVAAGQIEPDVGARFEQWLAAGGECELPWVRGADVLALGVPPGPLVAEILDACTERLDAIEAPTPAQIDAVLREVIAIAIKKAGPERR